MKHSSDIKHEIARLAFRSASPATDATSRLRYETRIARLQSDLPRALVRDITKLAVRLNYKADVYYAGRRLYPADGVRFQCRATPSGPALFHGSEEINLDHLADGNGNQIFI